MKWFALTVSVFAFVYVEASSIRATAERDARAWLRSKGSQPNADELAELRTENPSAYALVKALLVKQQLGLLDPRHPNKALNAAAAPPAVSDEDKASLAKMESEVKTRTAPEQVESPTAVYPEASAPPAKHDWFNWKPTDSATSDDKMVSSVLGEVAALKGGTAPSLVTKHAEANAASLSATEASATSVSVGASAESSMEKNLVARSNLASDSSILASNAGSSALASEGAALGFDTGDATPATPAQTQTATVSGDSVAPKKPNQKNAFWGSLFDNVGKDIKPAVVHATPPVVNQDVEASVPTSQRAHSTVGAPQQAVPQNSYLSQYGLETTASATQPKASSDGPNPYLEMSGMTPSNPQSSLISSRAKVQSVPETSSNPYLKGLNLFD